MNRQIDTKTFEDLRTIYSNIKELACEPEMMPIEAIDDIIIKFHDLLIELMGRIHHEAHQETPS